MITFFSGGTGTPKLLQGFRRIIDDHEITVVVNTAEDMWISGNHLSPDIDTIIYLFAGILNTDTWWGIKGDTFVTHKNLVKMGIDEYIAIGDQDRAVQITRGEMLRCGMSLTEATTELCRAFGITASVLPMSDQEIATYVGTDEEEIHFQEYWVRHRGKVRIKDVIRRSPEPPQATNEVIDAIGNSDAVVIGPSNPVTSISPILECAGVKDLLEEKFVIAISPFIGDTPVSGPAAALMQAWGLEPSSKGTYNLYSDFVDVFIQDRRDRIELDGALRLDTLMTGVAKSEGLAWEIMSIVRDAVK